MSSSQPEDANSLVELFDYNLPPELIAQTPVEPRDASRLMLLDRTSGRIEHRMIRELPQILRSGDLLIANNSRVLPARLVGVKSDSGGRVELLLLNQVSEGIWRCMVKPARRLRDGQEVTFLSHDQQRSATATLVTRESDGLALFSLSRELEQHLDQFGHVPLPPYIHKKLANPERYQTTYASAPGSAAAPTAGLHVTPALRQDLKDHSIEWGEITLHIGLDTFKPVTVDRVEDHRIHSEWCSVGEEVIEQIRQARLRGGRVIALGTTTARTLEAMSQRSTDTPREAWSANTSIFITPGHQWQVVDGMLTNFHLPRSTLLMMVSAMAGRDNILAAYQQAIDNRYRFYSFGDAMLIV